MRSRRVLTLFLSFAGCSSFVINSGGCTCAQPPSGDVTDTDDGSDAAQVFDDIQDDIDAIRDDPNGDPELASRLDAFLTDLVKRECISKAKEDPEFVPPNALCLADYDTDGDGDIDETDVITRFRELLEQP